MSVGMKKAIRLSLLQMNKIKKRAEFCSFFYEKFSKTAKGIDKHLKYAKMKKKGENL